MCAFCVALHNGCALDFADEITASRGGIARDLQTWTQQNSIQLLIDGENFFASLFADIVSTQKGDFIEANLFSENGDLMLDPHESNPKATALLKVLQGASVCPSVARAWLFFFSFSSSNLACVRCISLSRPQMRCSAE